MSNSLLGRTILYHCVNDNRCSVNNAKVVPAMVTQEFPGNDLVNCLVFINQINSGAANTINRFSVKHRDQALTESKERYEQWRAKKPVPLDSQGNPDIAPAISDEEILNNPEFGENYYTLISE